MYAKLMLGALLAVGPQHDSQPTEIDVHVPAVRVEVPVAVYVPPVRIDLPGSWGESQEVETDTTFAVNPEAGLSVRNHAGQVVIRTWERDQVRVRAHHSSQDRVKILTSGSSVQIKSEARFGPPDVVDYEITVPGSMSLDLWGLYADISVDGARNGLRAETLNGDIRLTNVAGQLAIHSVEGGLIIQNGEGRLEANNVEDDISVLGFRGDVTVGSIDGDIRLDGIEAASVEVRTVDGDIDYTGSIRDDGRYQLTTHDGDVTLRIPEGVNATVSVATFDGEFEAAFPVQLNRTEANRRFSFTLGKGGARVELHSFDGDIRLIRR